MTSHPYLLGKWEGQGRFLDVDLHNEVGLVELSIDIQERDVIVGSLGEATLTNTAIKHAKYGFEIKGILDGKVKNDMSLSKDHLIVLLVLPEGDRQNVNSSEANFHLKGNYTFDLGMRVGGVTLAKE